MILELVACAQMSIMRACMADRLPEIANAAILVSVRADFFRFNTTSEIIQSINLGNTLKDAAAVALGRNHVRQDCWRC